MADPNKLVNMLGALNGALSKMHNSEDLNDAVAELEVHIDDVEAAQDIEKLIDGLFDTIQAKFEEVIQSIAFISKKNIDAEGVDLTPESIDEMAEIAQAFYDSGDPLLIKQASVLDEILFTLGNSKSAVIAYKKAEEEELAKLREKARSAALEKSYVDVQKELDDQNKVAETGKAIKDQVKVYRSLEAPLSTRTCPDHPGAQMARIGDSTYQCSMDKKVYNWESGFETMKGSKVPGGGVQYQIPEFGTRDEGDTVFDTRESVTNRVS